MDVVIVGAHGKIGLQLGRLLSQRGDRVRGVIRNADHRAELGEAGIEPVIADLEADDAVAALTDGFQGADAVVFAAGAGPDSGAERKQTVDYEGAVKSADAAVAAGVRRIVVISSIGADHPPVGDPDDVMTVYLRAKGSADEAIRARTVSHTIVRPGALTDDPPTGLVQAGGTVERSEIPRADVAAVLVAALDEHSAVGRTFEVVAGERPIAEAVGSLASDPSTLG